METLSVFEVLSTSNTLGQLLLASSICDKVMGTPRFQQEKSVDVVVSFNGVEINAEEFTKILDEHLTNVDEYFQDKYSDIEQEVQKRVKEHVEELLETQVNNMLQGFQDLQDKVSSVNAIVKYSWEK